MSQAPARRPDDDLEFARPDGSFAQPWDCASPVKDVAQRAGVKLIARSPGSARFPVDGKRRALGSRQ